MSIVIDSSLGQADKAYRRFDVQAGRKGVFLF